MPNTITLRGGPFDGKEWDGPQARRLTICDPIWEAENFSIKQHVYELHDDVAEYVRSLSVKVDRLWNVWG